MIYNPFVELIRRFFHAWVVYWKHHKLFLVILFVASPFIFWLLESAKQWLEHRFGDVSPAFFCIGVFLMIIGAYFMIKQAEEDKEGGD